MSQRWRLLPVLFVALAVGCGDDADGDTSAAATTSGGGMATTTSSSTSSTGGMGGSGGTMTSGGGQTGGDTYANFAKDWFTMYCTQCHPGNGGSRDHSMFAGVQADAATIRCGVSPQLESGCSGSPQPSQFPVGGGPFPDDASRNRLVAWIDAGMPQ
jgi:hypothetical protein